ncbi:hypothetical protein EUGRSUZ_E03615 [Eucalyptus grandis]|uniref:Uncharacterized protein n=2 Tax=Eucalyptus grandis TaxID=71139 RepID=A0ACC3L1S8_EUCGR|nr:hypothetical protein EUGRSUZ_E03615 [Eucalyptus grandis]
MKLGLNRTSGLNRILTSWKSQDDPGTGTTYLMINPNGFPHLTLFKNKVPLWQPCPWIGVWSMISWFNFIFVIDANEVVQTSNVINSSIFVRAVVQESGSMQLFRWAENKSEWVNLFTKPVAQCDFYGYCGANGNCYSDIACKCLPGMRDSSGGCIRKNQESVCRNGEGFVKVADVKVPDTSAASFDMNMTLRECESECMRNCSCTAYADADFTRGGRGCLMWYGDLMDTREVPGLGRDLYVRVDALVLGNPKRENHNNLSCGIYCARSEVGKELEGTTEDQELPLLDITTIKAATDNFASTNKLGQGGFGPVYKGRLASGQEVAVKRLSKSSGQGCQEFKNEVMLIAKLQHRNLVRLLSCCISLDERMLIYEYLPNKSLDCFIFNEAKRTTLDWNQRFKIILGIARGVLYLHQDSRHRIIHRDLKASNVLLDAAMNPKISDFGMAKMFAEDQIQANTNKVVGTYGYMSPEYAMQGLYSTKSDVFSFGVILLEIVSGKRNTDFYSDSGCLNLIAHVWNLWKEGISSEIVDSLMAQPYNTRQVSRSIQIGLLCVQERAAHRPNMMDIVFMLGNEAALASPDKPAFILKGSGNILDLPPIAGASANEVTITELDGR